MPGSGVCSSSGSTHAESDNRRVDCVPPTRLRHRSYSAGATRASRTLSPSVVIPRRGRSARSRRSACQQLLGAGLGVRADLGDLRALSGRAKDGAAGQDRVVVVSPGRDSGPAQRGSSEPEGHLPRLGHAGTLAGWQAGGWPLLQLLDGRPAAVRGWVSRGWMGGLADGADVGRGRAGDAGECPAGAMPRTSPG